LILQIYIISYHIVWNCTGRGSTCDMVHLLMSPTCCQECCLTVRTASTAHWCFEWDVLFLSDMFVYLFILSSVLCVSGAVEYSLFEILEVLKPFCYFFTMFTQTLHCNYLFFFHFLLNGRYDNPCCQLLLTSFFYNLLLSIFWHFLSLVALLIILLPIISHNSKSCCKMHFFILVCIQTLLMLFMYFKAFCTVI